MATQPFFLCLKIVGCFLAKGPGLILTPHSYFILYNTFKETLFLAFIFKGLREHLGCFFLENIPHSFLESKNRYQGVRTHSSLRSVKLGACVGTMNIVRERSISKIYHYSKRIWSGANALRNL